MAGNRTLTIIKPDAFAGGKAGQILAHLEGQGFKPLAARVLRLSKAQAEEFYVVHRERPFFSSLVTFMTSGKCMPMILEREDAVAELRRHFPTAVRNGWALVMIAIATRPRTSTSNTRRRYSRRAGGATAWMWSRTLIIRPAASG